MDLDPKGNYLQDVLIILITLLTQSSHMQHKKKKDIATSVRPEQ